MENAVKQTTLADVAAYAGVTTSTASYYFRGTKKLSRKLEQKLDEGARVLKYIPIHGRHRPVDAQKARLINMCINVENKDNSGDDIYFFNMMNGVMDCIAEHGYQLTISRLVEGKPETEDIFHSNLGLTTGVILCNPRKDRLIEDKLIEKKIPYVILGSSEKTESTFYVDIDMQGVGFQVTEHLIAKGHRRILFLNLAESMLQSQHRREGFIIAYKQRGLKFNDADHVFAPVSAEICRKIVIDSFDRVKDYSAVVTSNEIQAQGVLQAMKELKIDVPSEAAIISMGGTILGSLAIPSLTTIDFNPHKHGYKSAQLLLEVLAKKRIKPFHLILPGNLVERDSTSVHVSVSKTWI